MSCREKIVSNEYADILTDFIIEPDSPLRNMDIDYCYQNIEGTLGILYVNRAYVEEFDVSTYGYLYIPKCYGLMDFGKTGIGAADISGQQFTQSFDALPLINSGMLALQGAPLNLTGKGVVVGIIDTGIQYENKVFQTADGSSRILALWDQTIQTGTPPADLLYGSEYTREDINRALQSGNPQEIVPSTDEIGHGTELASVAAGSILEGGERFIGAAPDADIVVVKLKQAKEYLKDYYMIPEGVPAYAASDLWSGIKYLDSFAKTFQRPVVICIGIGTNLGEHSGLAGTAQYLRTIASKRNRAVVICGGNEGNEAHHYEGNIILPKTDNWEDVEVRVGENEQGFIMELWGCPSFSYTISIRSPAGETIPRIYYRAGQTQRYSFIYDTTQISVDFSLVEQSSGDELILMRFQNPTAGIWTIRVFAEGSNGIANYHMWLPIREFSSSETYFLNPNPYVTLTVPGLTEGAITTSTYSDRNNSFYIESGRGFTRNGRIKPDIAAPGVNISTILGTRTGSSYAAAIAAGAVAQFLQWAVIEDHDVMVNSNDIRNYFISGASRDDSLSYPNREWGYGRLNLAGVFQWLAGLR